MILLIILFLLFTYSTAYLHYHEIEVKNKPINHNIWTLYRGVFFLINTLIYTSNISAVIVLTMLQSALYWVLFEILLNSYRDRPLLYVGYTAEIDKFFRREFPAYPEKAMLSAKIILLFLALILTIIVIK